MKMFNQFMCLSDDDLDELRQSKGMHAQFLCDISKFYRDWHVKSDAVYGNHFHCFQTVDIWMSFI